MSSVIVKDGESRKQKRADRRAFQKREENQYETG